MKDFFGLVLFIGLSAFTIGCGGSTEQEPAAEPPAEEIEENEGMGEVPGA